MKDFLAGEDRALLEAHGLADFDALWALELPLVDVPNVERGGLSSVARLSVGERAYYLKRQTNHLTRSLARPFGEPTFAREFRNIQRYRRRGIPALDAAFYGERRQPGEYRAILLTRALDGWRDLESWQDDWSELAAAPRAALLDAVGALARRLHGSGLAHGCFYPKHIFLRARGEAFDACLIDLEKTHPLWLGERSRVRDLEPLIRRSKGWGEEELRRLLSAYLAAGEQTERWIERLSRRRRAKGAG